MSTAVQLADQLPIVNIAPTSNAARTPHVVLAARNGRSCAVAVTTVASLRRPRPFTADIRWCNRHLAYAHAGWRWQWQVAPAQQQQQQQ